VYGLGVNPVYPPQESEVMNDLRMQKRYGFNYKFEIAMKTNCWKSIFFCFAAASIFFSSLPVFAESTLQVKCVDSSGAPVPAVKVTIAPVKALQKIKDKKSDDQGVAEFAKVDDGAYRVFGRKDGLMPALLEFAVLKGSQESVTLRFTAGADKKLWFEDPAEEQKAKTLLQQGVETAKANKVDEGIKILQEALAIKPPFAEALFYLGLGFIQQGKFDEAVQALDKASDIASIWLTAPQGSGQNPYQQIIQNVQQMKKNLPGLKAGWALQQKNYALAVKGFTEAIRSNPNEPDFHANLAIALAYSQKYDEALAAIDRAIQLKPSDTYTGYKNSIAAMKEKAEIDKAQAVFAEGNKLLQDGDAAGALQKLQQAKSMVAPDKQAPIWRQIGKAQAKLNQPEAVESFKKAIELAPADKVKDYRDSLVLYYMDAKKCDEAVDFSTDPKSANPELNLQAFVKNWKDKQPKCSEVALERVLKTNPENIDAAFDLGQMYYSDGKENDRRTKELLTKYAEKGKDADKLESVKGMLVIINRRTK